MKDDLISRQAAIDALGDGALVNYQFAGHDNGLIKAISVIKGLPTAEPKKGNWLPLADGWACCSECEHLERAAGLRWRYCPNCGARMEESDG